MSVPTIRTSEVHGEEVVGQFEFPQAGLVDFFSNEGYQLLLKPVFVDYHGAQRLDHFELTEYPASAEMQAEF